MSNITYDGTINPDRPDLPFAQASQFNPMWSGTINPDRPNLPFAQTMTGAVNKHMTKSTSGNYTIYWKNGGQSTMELSNTVANHYRTLGHTVVLNNAKSSEKDIVKLDDGIPRAEIEKIFIDYYGDDISLLHTHASELGAAMKRAKDQRDEIEARINKLSSSYQPMNREQILSIVRSEYQDDIDLLHSNISDVGTAYSDAKAHRDEIENKVTKGQLERAGIHTKLTGLGKSVSDVSAGLEAHKAEDTGGGILGGLLGGGMIGLAVIGVGAYFLLRKKR